VAALTGLRFGELRSLRWRDIEWTAANLHVRKNLPVHATEEKEPKSEEGRSVPMFDQVAREFERLSRRGYLTELDDLVFVSVTGGRLDYEHTKDAFYAALEGAGFAHLRARDRKPKPFTFHDLRHTYGTLAVQIYPLSDVQAYMGHADIKTTMVYVHHVPKTDAAAKGSAFVAAAMAGTEIGTELPSSTPTERNSEQPTPA
jgi:integrase